ncbi:hypothetical protein [Jiangella alkaliphila]|uniref:Uncharacterized protein n=1 Tax=Jiangella alkaliphila TaxID=419479 RepID=A0A1H2GEG1_9ACTN|nr:hypothetical protein [Jiangella alkaliphila]SDU17965.1 hypothetical protein SAMN04488563_0452 [Jiangella alkaliphila]
MDQNEAIVLSAAIGAGGVIAGVLLSFLSALVQEFFRRRHERSERRYEDKRATYVKFALACSEAERDTWEFEEQYGHLPADHPGLQDVEGHESLVTPYMMIEIFAPGRVKEAAYGYVQAINRWAYFRGSSDEARGAREKFIMEMQNDLKFKSRRQARRELEKERRAEVARRAAADAQWPDPPPGVTGGSGAPAPGDARPQA